MSDNRHPFGKDFTVKWEYESEFSPSADAPTIYVFSERPSQEQAQDGSGGYLVETVSSWSAASEANTQDISVSAIADPKPNSNETEQDYFLGINYTIATGEDGQTEIHEIILYRPMGAVESHGVTTAIIKEFYPSISNYLSDAEIDDQKDIAVRQLKEDLLKINPLYRWEKIKDRDRLYLPIAYKSIANAMLIQFCEDGDSKHIRMYKYEALYQDAIDSLILDVDLDQDGDHDSKVTVKQGFTTFIR